MAIKRITEYFPIRDEIRNQSFFQMLELKAAETYRKNPTIRSMLHLLIFAQTPKGETVIEQRYVRLNPEVVYSDEEYVGALKKAYGLIEEIEELKDEKDPDLRNALFLGQFLVSIGAEVLRAPDRLTLITPSTIALLAKTFEDESSPIITVILRDPGDSKEWEFLGCSGVHHVQKGSDEIQ